MLQNITVSNLLVWLLIALVGGFLGELIARRRTPEGIIGAMIIGFLGMLLVVGLLNIHLANDQWVAGAPLFTSLIVAAICVAIWSGLAYRHVHRRYNTYYRRGTYARRPRRRFRLF